MEIYAKDKRIYVYGKDFLQDRWENISLVELPIPQTVKTL